MKTAENFRGINDRLDKIIELLTSIDQARIELGNGDYVPDPFCECHKKGQTSAVVVCPRHG